MVLVIYIGIWEMQHWFGSGNKYENKINEHWHYIEETGGKKRAKKANTNLWHTSFVCSE